MTRKKRFVRWVLLIVGGLFLLLLVTTAVSALFNTQLPTHSQNPAQLSANEKARVREVTHLRQTVGNIVWPAWGDADIPLIVYNEGYAFLLNYPDEPAEGWLEAPDLEPHGVAWEMVADDLFAERPYYRQKLGDGESPQAFTVLVGDRWVASLATKEWMKVDLIRQIRQEMPNFLRPFFPYSLFVNQLLNSSEHYVALFLHESFHAFQGHHMPTQFAEAERATRFQEQYPQDDAFITAWQAELDLLTAALQATSKVEKRELAQQFLQQRQTRRQDAHLSVDLIRYEQQREWLEGSAKYVELSVWQEASRASEYESWLMSDDDFHQYTNFERQWQREVMQMGRMADDDGDGRFYYSGWAQATLLDVFLPEWKQMVSDGDVTLEQLLAEAVAQE